MHTHIPQLVTTAIILVGTAPHLGAANAKMFVFNSDGGAAAIAHFSGKVTRKVICQELDELESTAVTDFFWCPIVGGNVFIYPTKVGERMGDNITDWNKVHPYYRKQGQAMADNLRQLMARGEDPIRILSARAKLLGIRFWLSCRMNEIHEDDDRFMAVRSKFKARHPELLHGKNFHPEAIYAPQKGYSYAWNYGKAEVRKHFLALFQEWLQYDIDGIELDFCRSPCLFPPGQERAGSPQLTEFLRELRRAVRDRSQQTSRKMRLAIRVPPSRARCVAAGIDIDTWIEERLVDVVTPMDRGYFDPAPKLSDFAERAKQRNVIVLGGIEPKVRGYRQHSRQTFAAVSSFLHSGADGIYLFNYDCHRLQAASSKFGGVLKPYTKDEAFFLKTALDAEIVRYRDKQFLVSQATNLQLAEKGGDRPLRCRLPVGTRRTFRLTVEDDLQEAQRRQRLRQTRLLIRLQHAAAPASNLDIRINGRPQKLKPADIQAQRDLLVVTIDSPPVRQGRNTIEVGLKQGDAGNGLIHSIDLNVGYTALPPQLPGTNGASTKAIEIGDRKQLFVDHRMIASSSGIALTMNSPQRDGRPWIVPDQPWEQDAHISVYSSVLREQQKVRVWYDLIKVTGAGPYDHERMVAYAESRDGLHFTKPKLGLHELGGSKANNLVLPSKIGGSAVWIDARAEAAHRYKTQAKVYPSGEFHMHSSPDGLHWKLFAKPHPGPGGHDTQSIVFWDNLAKSYTLFTRYWAHRRDPHRRYRAVRRLVTDDLTKGWRGQTIVMAPDEIERQTYTSANGTAAIDYYGACVFPYSEAPEVTIMLAQAFWHWQPRDPLKGLGPSGFDVRLAVSRDGKTFQRLGDRKPFMAMGREDKFDARYVWVLPNPIRVGDEIWIYYAGSNRDHDGNIARDAPGGKHLTGIGRAVLRLDGFVSADAGYRGGQITTPLLSFDGSQLELNVATAGGGAVEVEILDPQHRPLPGFTRADAYVLNGNSVRLQVGWKKRDSVAELAGRPVHLRFHLRDCKLYAFQFRP